MTFVFRRAIAVYQFRIAVYGSQRCAQLVGDGVHDFLTIGDKFAVPTVGFLQPPYQFRSFLSVSVDTLGVQVDDDVGYYQQKKDKSRQPSDLQE